MLQPYSRHLARCKYKAKGIHFLGCDCPKWVYGQLHGRAIREALRTRNLTTAMQRIELMQREPEPPPATPKLSEAIALFLADCASRGLQQSTTDSYRDTLLSLQAFAADCQITAITPELLTMFRASRIRQPRNKSQAPRPITVATSRKELEHMRALFNFAVRMGWIQKNPASAVRMPRERLQDAEPFDQAEVNAMLTAANCIGPDADARSQQWRVRARALILVMLYTGLRASDVAKLKRSALDGKTHYLTLRTQKNGVRVRVKLPELVIRALDALPAGNHFFWNGESQISSVTGQIRVTLNRIAQRLSFPIHPHRFRDSFCARLLQQGAQLRTVQILLGHNSIKTTEKHYSHFQAAHQQLLDRATATLDFADEAPRVLVMPAQHH